MHPHSRVQHNVILSGRIINLYEMEEVMEKLTEKKKNCAIATAVSEIKSLADQLWEIPFEFWLWDGKGRYP